MPLANSLGIEQNPVGFFDSGVGGLPYLALAVEKLPHEQFVYIADTLHYPYGKKTPQAIRNAVLGIMEIIIKKINPKCMVIACNTASVVALNDLREKFNIPFIGVVPAVKPAAAFSEKKKIGVLATLRTVKDRYLKHLISDFANGCEVAIVPAESVRDLVEKRFFSACKEEKKAHLNEVVKELKARGVDSVVLGCTHFLHLIDEFKQVLGNNISIIDSRKGVINQLIRILQTHGIKAKIKTKQNLLYITGKTDNEDLYIQFSEKYNLFFSGML